MCKRIACFQNSLPSCIAPRVDVQAIGVNGISFAFQRTGQVTRRVHDTRLNTLVHTGTKSKATKTKWYRTVKSGRHTGGLLCVPKLICAASITTIEPTSALQGTRPQPCGKRASCGYRITTRTRPAPEHQFFPGTPLSHGLGRLLNTYFSDSITTNGCWRFLDVSSERCLTSNAATGVDIGVDQRHLAWD